MLPTSLYFALLKQTTETYSPDFFNHGSRSSTSRSVLLKLHNNDNADVENKSNSEVSYRK